uniref:Uncharacterized protein n=1 Tax=Euplotes crassus TaxID=5936 RepID=A0A7S3KDD9_EUPCR|mmetsp:Transcript_2200/g.2074  ORF Transcript_2200/g.2074 Transcript_2200/m.2074 type:complete len:181 (+) Transcript_2200:33-575(+)
MVRVKPLQGPWWPDRKHQQTTFEFILEIMTYVVIIVEVLTIGFIVIKAMQYLTLEDEEAIALIAVGSIHSIIAIMAAIFMVVLVQYLRDYDSVTLKEFDKVSTIITTWMLEQLFLLIGTALVTYYVIYVIQYYPGFEDMISVLMIILFKFVVITAHYTMFVQIKHHDDPLKYYLVPVQRV